MPGDRARPVREGPSERGQATGTSSAAYFKPRWILWEPGAVMPPATRPWGSTGVGLGDPAVTSSRRRLQLLAGMICTETAVMRTTRTAIVRVPPSQRQRDQRLPSRARNAST